MLIEKGFYLLVIKFLKHPYKTISKQGKLEGGYVREGL